ncbi:MAG: DUF2834 domain-containing protein [Actinomycetales bacterium]|nr:DUF2834 domain-containing protein [Actinomycetales bacterium]
MNKRAWFFFILSGIGLVTAWLFNALGIMQGANFLDAWFAHPADLVVSYDLLISATAAVAFMIWDSKQIGFRRVWILILLGFVSAVAFVFPLYLALRELKLSGGSGGSAGVKALGRKEAFNVAGREYLAWVPNNVNAKTPVLIVHDAQNYMLDRSKTWNGQNWGLEEAIAQGRVMTDSAGNLPLVVSIHLQDVACRMNELAPEDFMAAHPEAWNNLPPELMPPTKELRGNAYIDDVVDNLLPELERRYGVKLSPERTAIGGSSMGGLASLYAMSRHPQVFAAALAYSTHWPIGQDDLVDYYLNKLPRDGKHILWSDRGDLDIDAGYAPFHERFIAGLTQAGWVRDRDFIAAVQYGTGHNENYWARRIEEPINWWLSRL